VNRMHITEHVIPNGNLYNCTSLATITNTITNTINISIASTMCFALTSTNTTTNTIIIAMRPLEGQMAQLARLPRQLRGNEHGGPLYLKDGRWRAQL